MMRSKRLFAFLLAFLTGLLSGVADHILSPDHHYYSSEIWNHAGAAGSGVCIGLILALALIGQQKRQGG